MAMNDFIRAAAGRLPPAAPEAAPEGEQPAPRIPRGNAGSGHGQGGGLGAVSMSEQMNQWVRGARHYRSYPAPEAPVWNGKNFERRDGRKTGDNPR